MRLRIEERRLEVEGRTYVLRCNMAVLDALEATYGDFQAVMALPIREATAAILAAMLNDCAEDRDWPTDWTARKVKKAFPYAALLELDIIGMLTRAVTPANADAEPETNTEPGDDAGN